MRTFRFDVAATDPSPNGRSVGVRYTTSVAVATSLSKAPPIIPAIAGFLGGRAAAGVGAGALAGSKGLRPLFMREGAEEAGDSAFDKLKDLNQRRQEMADRDAADKQRMSEQSRSATNPASTNTTQFS